MCLHAYYSIKVAEEHTDLLKFSHRGVNYKFLALPNGYLHGPRKFTKIMKVPLSVLRLEGINISAYLDDCIIMAADAVTSIRHTSQTVQLFESLGFTVHPEPKSSLFPSTRMEFLGFVLDSMDMTILPHRFKNYQTEGILPGHCEWALCQN